MGLSASVSSLNMTKLNEQTSCNSCCLSACFDKSQGARSLTYSLARSVSIITSRNALEYSRASNALRILGNASAKSPIKNISFDLFS